MRILLLTSSPRGIAPHHLSLLLKNSQIETGLVILNLSKRSKHLKYFKQKFFKVLKIGLLGAINGTRIRKWFSTDVEKNLPTESLQTLCKRMHIPYYEVDNLYSETVRSIMKDCKADLGVSINNGYIPKSIFTIPRYGMINIHHEILPEFRNAQPVLWQIYHGSTETGITIHAINSTIDSGDIVFQERVLIQFRKSLRETVSATCTMLWERSADALQYVVENFEECRKHAVLQKDGLKYTTPNYWQFRRMLAQHKRLLNKMPDAEMQKKVMHE
jgi:methionyl-tRNA formyltransferase